MLKGDLKAVFPNLSDDDALHLAWGGLEGTSYYALKSQSFRNDVHNTNIKYSTKPVAGVNPEDTKGQYCY